MYERFGEFDSAAEINRAAAAQKEEGDLEAIKALAVENGLDEEDAQNYIDGIFDELTTLLAAAVGKIRLEEKEYKIEKVLKDWLDELIAWAAEDPQLTIGIRRKGKSIAGYIALLAESGYENRAEVDKRIVGMTKEIKKILRNHPLAIGVPDRKTRKQIAAEYFIKGGVDDEGV